jgi:hypothetical protein
MSSKKGHRPENKKSKGDVENPGGGENQESVAAAAAVKTSTPRKPMGTVPERLVDKADHVYSIVNDALQLMVKRDVPSDVELATKECLSQVEAWREKIFGLKSSGWVPVEGSASKDIVEGDHLRIAPDMRETYQYIFDALGVVPGEEDLVAGLVVKTKRSSRVLVKKLGDEVPGVDDAGQPLRSSDMVFGYVTRSHLVKRSA